MAKDDDVLEGMDNEEDLLDFDLEDITPEELDEGDSDEEVIDLVDLVEEGKGEKAPEDDEIANLLEPEQPQLSEEDISFSTDEISGIPDILDEDGAAEVEVDQSASVADISLSDLELDESITEPDEEVEIAAEVADEADAEADVEELDLGLDDEAVSEEERPEADIPEIDLSGVFEEGEEEAAPDQEEEVAPDDNIEEMLGATIEATVTEAVGPEEEMPGDVVAEEEIAPAQPSEEVVSMDSQAPAVSPEQIEAVVREVVEEVVERVVRETLLEVAEKVIREAIDALKQNLESSSE